MSNHNENCYMKTSEVADLLNVTTRTLLNWRRTKKGPSFVVWNKKQIRYPKNKVTEWIEKSSCDDF